MLQGQKLQGTITSNEVQVILQSNGWVQHYPLFTTVNLIVNGRLPPSAITTYRNVVKDMELMALNTPNGSPDDASSGYESNNNSTGQY